jgi:hypothetical protein
MLAPLMDDADAAGFDGALVMTAGGALSASFAA